MLRRLFEPNTWKESRQNVINLILSNISEAKNTKLDYQTFFFQNICMQLCTASG